MMSAWLVGWKFGNGIHCHREDRRRIIKKKQYGALDEDTTYTNR